MRPTPIVLYAWGIALCCALPVRAQDDARTAYFEAVSGFFRLPANEVAILGEWDVQPGEVPVLLFAARRAGISPEALVALRRSGMAWSGLLVRYGIGAEDLYIPIPDGAPAGALSGAYAQYRATPQPEWSEVRLSDAEVVALVNVRVLSQVLGLSPAGVMGRTEPNGSYVRLFAALSGGL